MQVRNWAIACDSLYIVKGPIFSDSMKVIGPHRVAVQKAYYKVLLKKRIGTWEGI
jgi:DNA/RNA endonuclease G (NUC1)